MYISSEILFPEFREHYGQLTADSNVVVIRRGAVPDITDEVIFRNSTLQVTSGEVLVNILDITRCLVKGDNEIIVQPDDRIEEDTLRVFIANIALTIILYRRNVFTLHASAIKVGEHAILVTGMSGMGKSTLAHGLQQKGYDIISDDISSVVFDADGNPCVYPGVKHLKLTTNTMNLYQHDTNNYRKLRKEVEKYCFPTMHDDNKPVPVKGVILLKQKNEGDIEVQEIDGMQKLHVVMVNSYKPRMVKALGKTAVHFTASSRFANKTYLKQVSRSFNSHPSEFADFIEKEILRV